MPLSIIALNVNSIINFDRKQLLAGFIRRNPADIYCLSETKLSSKIVTKFIMPGYRVINLIYKHNVGGTCLIIKNSIKVRHQRFGSIPLEYSQVECLINNDWIGINSIYVNNHGCNLEKFSKLFLSKGNNMSIFIGDFNSRHTTFGDIANNSNGTNLIKFIADHGSNFHLINPDKPTYFGIYPSHIDKCLIKNPIFGWSSLSTLPSFSDHLGIKIDFYVETAFTIENKIKIYNHTNIYGLNKYIEDEINSINIPAKSLLANGDLETISIKLEKIFQSGISKFVPTVSHDIRPPFSKNTKLMLKNIHWHRNKMNRNRKGLNCPLINKQHKGEIILPNILLKKSVRFDLNNAFKNKLIDSNNNIDIFKSVKQFTSHKKKLMLFNQYFWTTKK